MRLNFIKYQKEDSISRSLIRFFRYRTGYEVDCILPEQHANRSNLVSFALMDLNDTEKVCQLVHRTKIPMASIRILGYDDDFDVNLVKLPSLGLQLEQSMSPICVDDYRYLPAYQERIKMFFKGHGEESLLGCIGWVTYYFENYFLMFASGEYDAKGLYEHYLLPGMDYWGELVRRFSRYAPIIYTAGWDKKVMKIESLINEVSSEMNRQTGLKNIPIFEVDTIAVISEIRNILETIEKQINFCHGETPTTDH